MKAVRQWQSPDQHQFASDIAPAGEPALLCGVARDWPIVRQAALGPRALVAMLSAMASDAPVDVVSAGPEVAGRFHYADGLQGMNFMRGRTDLRTFLAAVMEQADEAQPRAIAAQGIHAETVLPGFDAAHPMPLGSAGATSRLWIGNAAKVATHNDPSDNIAVVAAGRRRFTLFPPDQLANLYLGPMHNTPAGTPVSMVHVTAPDLTRYPRFAEALAHAQSAELVPGDAIFIPYGWYHHVEALDPVFNMLVNYWWNDAGTGRGSPWDVLLHALLTLRDLPPGQRQLWRAMIDHYVFQEEGDPVAHLPPGTAGALGPVSDEERRLMARALADALARLADGKG